MLRKFFQILLIDVVSREVFIVVWTRIVQVISNLTYKDILKHFNLRFKKT